MSDWIAVKIYLKDGTHKVYGADGYIVLAKPNEHGDLIVYRTHPDMFVEQPMASYASGEWTSHEMEHLSRDADNE